MRAFDKEEKELMESVEKEDWIPVDNLDREIKKARETATATFRKSERMNVRMSPKDIRDLKVRALQEGMPYQTLVSSVIRKYLSGKLVEKEQ
jgi:predicted DNA binding CopG/RHH family protein